MSYTTRLVIIILTFLSFNKVQAQTVSLQDKIYYTCKVWGFAKYYHSEVSTCKVNWDSVLVRFLPVVKSAATFDEFNDALDSLLIAAGPMAIATTPAPAILPPELRRNIDFSWIITPNLRGDVKSNLTWIKDNFRPHPICWVQKNNNPNLNFYSYLLLPNDSVMLKTDPFISYPGEDQRLLLLFKEWNLVNYYNPYNHILDQPWDSTLYHYVIPFDTVSDAYNLYLALEQLTTEINDAHVEGLTYNTLHYTQPPGLYVPKIRLKYIDGEYVVIKSKIPGINVGDAVVLIDGLRPSIWESWLKRYISAGSVEVMRRDLADRLIAKDVYGASIFLVTEDINGNQRTFNLLCENNPYQDQQFFYSTYNPADSISSISWTTLPCDIGYVNIENLTPSEVSNMYNDLKDKPAIIFDMRGDLQATIDAVPDLLYDNPVSFSKLMLPDLNYPGTYYWSNEPFYPSAKPSPYSGKVIVLVNERTQSFGEYYTMLLKAKPGSIIVGGHTAGADGNISRWKLTPDTYTGFTTLGVYYPNESPTQRIGILADVAAHPTRQGIIDKRDEVLEKGMAAAGCFPNSVKKQVAAITDVSIYPNPCSDEATISIMNTGKDAAQLSITDITGRILFKQAVTGNKNIVYNTQGLASGIYYVQMKNNEATITRKLVKQ